MLVLCIFAVPITRGMTHDTQKGGLSAACDDPEFQQSVDSEVPRALALALTSQVNRQFLSTENMSISTVNVLAFKFWLSSGC